MHASKLTRGKRFIYLLYFSCITRTRICVNGVAGQSDGCLYVHGQPYTFDNMLCNTHSCTISTTTTVMPGTKKPDASWMFSFYLLNISYRKDTTILLTPISFQWFGVVLIWCSFTLFIYCRVYIKKLYCYRENGDKVRNLRY